MLMDNSKKDVERFQFETYAYKSILMSYIITLGGFIVLVILPFLGLTSFFLNPEDFNSNYLINNLFIFTLCSAPFLIIYIYYEKGIFEKIKSNYYS